MVSPYAIDVIIDKLYVGWKVAEIKYLENAKLLTLISHHLHDNFFYRQHLLFAPRPIVRGEYLSFKPHIIFNRLYSWDLARNIDCLVNVGGRIDEPTQLNNTLKSLDVHLRGF